MALDFVFKPYVKGLTMIICSKIITNKLLEDNNFKTPDSHVHSAMSIL